MQIIAPFLRVLNQLKIYHWQTNSYSQHKAFQKTHDNLSNLIDEFVEVFMGKYGRTKAKFAYNIELINYDEHFLDFVDSSIVQINEIATNLDAQDTELLNIKDEIVAALQKLKYLLSLN